MNDELRQAAERVKQHAEYYLREYVLEDHDDSDLRRHLRDQLALADNYLATPDQSAESREVTCVWCGHKFFSDLQSQAEHLYAHARTCEKHPIRTSEAKVARLTAENEKLRADAERLLGRLKEAETFPAMMLPLAVSAIRMDLQDTIDAARKETT